jgi:hypothetical protein
LSSPVNGQWWNVNENNVVPAKEMTLAASWSNSVVRFRTYILPVSQKGSS